MIGDELTVRVVFPKPQPVLIPRRTTIEVASDLRHDLEVAIRSKRGACTGVM